MKPIIVTVTSLACAGAILSIAGGGRDACRTVIPSELQQVAQSHGFVALSDFYCTHPGYVEPPFAWGIEDEGQRELSAAFWCGPASEGTDSIQNYYLLLVSRDNIMAGFRLVDSIKWSGPGGLSLLRDTLLVLESSVLVTDLERHGPRDAVVRATAIKNEYDGNTEIFFKYGEDWMVRFEYDW